MNKPIPTCKGCVHFYRQESTCVWAKHNTYAGEPVPVEGADPTSTGLGTCPGLNQWRVDQADLALSVFREREADKDHESEVVDLLTDLLHLFNAHFSYATPLEILTKILEQADRNFQAERIDTL